jgi:CMP/dCMP kinase
MNSLLITLAGDVGSGKSTVGRLVAEKLAVPYMSTGQMQREIARRHGLTTLQLNEQCMSDRRIDDLIDDRVRSIGSSPEPGVIDARLGWFFIPRSFKVFLSVDAREGARRTYTARRAEEENSDEMAVMKNNIARRQLENRRFRDLYGADCACYSNYDLVIDTTHADPSTVAGVVLSECAATGRPAGRTRYFVSPKRLLPTRPVGDLSSDAAAAKRSMHDPGFDVANPVAVVASEWFFVLVDGHRRTSRALQMGLSMIPCDATPFEENTVVQGRPARLFVHDRLKRSWIREWEEAHGFRFLSYPDSELRVELPD